MKKIKINILLIILITQVLNVNIIYGQEDITLSICSKYIKPPYVSDGQVYKALITGDEIAEFHVTFYGGTTYRIVIASGNREGNVVFSLYDKERNLIFTNRDHKYTPYWDFKFTSTVDCIIEAELLPTARIGSGILTMLIGFQTTY